MFKIHENGDGSTSIYCSKTGKLICTIRGQQRNMGLGCRPVNVVEPSPKPRSCCYNLDLRSGCLSDEDEKQNTRGKDCDLAAWDEPKEDFYDDCITPDQFARCLNLVPTETLKNESFDQLKSSFPLRHLSRTKEILINTDLQDMKLPDDIPLTSSLGVKLLKLNQQKNFSCDQNIDMKIKHYDSFCRFQLNTSSVCSNFPKLRCREKKEYPVCIPQKILRYSPTHMYAFNKRQRLEKLITLKTGLDTRSRRLLQKCNKRLAVSIKRLAPEEINFWLQKRSKRGPISFDCIKGEEPTSIGSNSDTIVIEPYSPICIDIDLSSDDSSDPNDGNDPSFEYHSRKETVNMKGTLNRSKNRLSPVRNKCVKFSKRPNNSTRFVNCSVNVRNVLNKVQKHFADYYVAGTNIRIPFCEEFLNSLDKKVLSGIVIPGFNYVTNSHHDHAYHRPFSQEASKKKLLSNSQCLNHKNSKTKNIIKHPSKISNCVRNKSSLGVKPNIVNDSNSLNSAINTTECAVKIVPIIDLTDDSACTLPVTEQKGNVSNWAFHCYGCGFDRKLMEKSPAFSLATKHMKDFHCVSDVKSFLNVINVNSGATIEAFPGYKSLI